MALYAIGDLHLSLGADKPMDVFGGPWENYGEKIKAYPVKAINDHWFSLPNGTKIELKLLENWKVNK